MILISPLDQVAHALSRYHPGGVISVLDDKNKLPDIAPLPHLAISLSMADATLAPCEQTQDPLTCHVRDIVQFANRHDWRTPLLVHCQLGLCRSPAAAYVIMCALSQPGSEEAHAQSLSRASTGIDPCLTLTSAADKWLQRDGAMIDAIACMDCGQTRNRGEIAEIPFTPTVSF